MNSDNKQIRDVADVAARIMSGQQPVAEELKGGQVKIDKNHNGKIDGQDFKILSGEKKVKEEVEQLDEIGNTPAGQAALKAVSARGDKEMSDWNKKPESGYSSTPKKVVKHSAGGMNADRRLSGQGITKGAEGRAQRQIDYANKMRGEEVESIDEVKMADLPSTKVQGRAYGASKPEPHPLDVMKGPSKSTMDTMAKHKKDKKFSEMVNLYQNGGMKSFLESLEKEEEDKLIDEVSKEIADYTMDVIDAGEYTEVTIGEEASQDEFNAEIEKAKAKSQGKDKAEVAKGAVQAVKQEGTEITDEMIFEVLESAGIDFESLNDEELQEITNEAYEILSSLKERHMTDAEMAKREKIAKSMKKGLAGFKERYGDRAKNVMYATATKQAMKEETESKHYKSGHEYASDHAQDAGFKVTARARKKEMLANNPHKKGTPEHSDWHRGANDGHQTALDNM